MHAGKGIERLRLYDNYPAPYLVKGGHSLFILFQSGILGIALLVWAWIRHACIATVDFSSV